MMCLDGLVSPAFSRMTEAHRSKTAERQEEGETGAAFTNWRLFCQKLAGRQGFSVHSVAVDRLRGNW